MAVKSYDVIIDGEPYVFYGSGIVLGDAISEPAPVSQLGSAIIENVANGLGPKLSRGNGYFDLHRLIPIVEGQLIFPPTTTVGSEFTLSGSQTYTAGIFHIPTPAGQYIAFGSRIYRLNLADFAGVTYTVVASSDCTAAPISNAAARYTGGGFVWRNKVYFGIENSANGQAIGFASIDFVANDAIATIVSSTTLGFSFGATNRGRIFIAQNQDTPNHTKLAWSPQMDTDYSALVPGTNLFGDLTTSGGTFIYGVEGRPRVSGVLMLGSAALFFREDGSVLASDEAGFTGIVAARSQSSGTLDATQGFGPVPYLDGAAYRVFAGGPHHINPVNLNTRSLSPGNVQDIPIEVQDPDIYGMYAVGEHLFMGGQTYLYDVISRGQGPVVHKLYNLKTLCANSNYVVGSMTHQGGILCITMYNSVSQKFQQLQMEVLPSLRQSTTALVGPVTGWMEPGILVGPDRASSMTKLWLQIRANYFTRVNAANTISFTNALVDETKAVSIASAAAVGPIACAITASPSLNALGRTLSFRLNMNPTGATGFNERLYLPIVADFLWSPSTQDMLTLTLEASGEQQYRAGGVMSRRSSREIADALNAKQRTVISLTFSDGKPTPATWSLFVEKVEATRIQPDSKTHLGQDPYEVKMVCRRLS